MGLLDGLLGNASELNPAEISKEFADILIDGETIQDAYRVIRDKYVFTNRRFIYLNVKGITGAKRKYHSIPYSSITQFSVETAGTFDDDCEMYLWVKGSEAPYHFEFSRGINVKGIQKALARHIL